jgi:hypothetical protein
VMLNSTLWERRAGAANGDEPQSPIRGDATRPGSAEPEYRPRAGNQSERVTNSE